MRIRHPRSGHARLSANAVVAPPSQPASGEAGFSVLEAIVALAILGATIVPLLAWQSQMARDTVAIERSLNSKIAEGVALRYLQLLNPLGASSGKQTLGGGWELEWTALPVTPTMTLRAGLNDPGRHAATLYNVQAQLRSARGGAVELDTTVMGIEERQTFEPF